MFRSTKLITENKNTHTRTETATGYWRIIRRGRTKPRNSAGIIIISNKNKLYTLEKSSRATKAEAKQKQKEPRAINKHMLRQKA